MSETSDGFVPRVLERSSPKQVLCRILPSPAIRLRQGFRYLSVAPERGRSPDAIRVGCIESMAGNRLVGEKGPEDLGVLQKSNCGRPAALSTSSW